MATLYVLKPIGIDGELLRPGTPVDSARVGDDAHVQSLTKEGFFSAEPPKKDDAPAIEAEVVAPAVVSQAVVDPEPVQEDEKPKKGK